jgi:hypothetical protein
VTSQAFSENPILNELFYFVLDSNSEIAKEARIAIGFQSLSDTSSSFGDFISTESIFDYDTIYEKPLERIKIEVFGYNRDIAISYLSGMVSKNLYAFEVIKGLNLYPIDVLKKFFEDKKLKCWAVRMLGRFNNKEALGYLHSFLKDMDVEAKLESVEGLRNFGDIDSLKFLENILYEGGEITFEGLSLKIETAKTIELIKTKYK